MLSIVWLCLAKVGSMLRTQSYKSVIMYSCLIFVVCYGDLHLMEMCPHFDVCVMSAFS